MDFEEALKIVENIKANVAAGVVVAIDNSFHFVMRHWG